jgi:hypothetical protein
MNKHCFILKRTQTHTKLYTMHLVSKWAMKIGTFCYLTE